MIKLIASDVDGTLVEDGTFRLNPEYYDLIKELDKRGILFVAASGRQYSSMKRLFSPVLDNMDFISESGAAIWKKERAACLWQFQEAMCWKWLKMQKKSPVWII